MTRFFAALAAVAIQLGAQPAQAQAPAGAPTSNVSLPPKAFTAGAVRPEARELALLMVPEDLYLDLVERAIAAPFDQMTEVAELEASYPGITAALKADLGKAARRHFKAEMPATIDRYARALGSSFTAQEVTELSKFYASKIGQKMIVAKYTGLDLSHLTQRFVEDPNATVSEEDVKALNRAVVRKALPHLDAADLDALRAFGKSPLYPRMAAFVPVMTALEVQISGEPTPAFDAEIEQITKDIMERFIAPKAAT